MKMPRKIRSTHFHGMQLPMFLLIGVLPTAKTTAVDLVQQRDLLISSDNYGSLKLSEDISLCDLCDMPYSALPSSHAEEACSAQSERMLTDFTPATQDLGWFVLNDNVMGGQSQGHFVLEPNHLLRFTGRTNTRGGGFSSIRTGSLDLDLSTWTGIRLRVQGDGRNYIWRLSSSARWQGQPFGYWATFGTIKDQWKTVDIPFSQFIPRFRGRYLEGPPLDTTDITGLGLMIYDGESGPFTIRVDSVQAYSDRGPILARYLWKHRLLILSASSPEDPNIIQLAREITATAEAFAERDMLLITLLQNGPSLLGDHPLTEKEIVCIRKEVHILKSGFELKLIGKDGHITRSSTTAVPVTDIYQQIDAMPMRAREVQASKRNQE